LGLLSLYQRFPPPWTVEELDACFVVRDHSGQKLAYVYFEDEPGCRASAILRGAGSAADSRQSSMAFHQGFCRKHTSVTSGTDTIAVMVSNPPLGNQEGIMSVLYHTSEKAEFKHPDHGFILAVICMALAVVVASAIFTPAPVGNGITSEITSVGP
jgi:hypothetical protein